MYNSDKARTRLFESALNSYGYVSDRVVITLEEKRGMYTEIIKEDEFKLIFGAKIEYQNLSPLQIAEKFVNERIEAVLESKGYTLDDDIDFQSSDFYDGYELNVPFRLNESFDPELFYEELDAIVNRPKYTLRRKSSIGGVEKPDRKIKQELPDNEITPTSTKSRSSVGGVEKPSPKSVSAPIPEPGKIATSDKLIPLQSTKTQDPHKVDLLLKSVFESKFLEYKLSTDLGFWKPIKTLTVNGKLVITWENVDHSNIKIEMLIFEHNSNKISIKVLDRDKVIITHYFEVYRIPTNEFLVEKFYRKTFFNLLKKFIDTKVITIDPFLLNFVFWKTDNPSFSYSFSSPKKNKIIKDLIAFISIAKHPILDDFFEANNIKHKQGYLQNLLDSSEAAGIFKFVREGNEIIIIRGLNYKAFINGKIRRVMS